MDREKLTDGATVISACMCTGAETQAAEGYSSAHQGVKLALSPVLQGFGYRRRFQRTNRQGAVAGHDLRPAYLLSGERSALALESKWAKA